MSDPETISPETRLAIVETAQKTLHAMLKHLEGVELIRIWERRPLERDIHLRNLEGNRTYLVNERVFRDGSPEGSIYLCGIEKQRDGQLKRSRLALPNDPNVVNFRSIVISGDHNLKELETYQKDMETAEKISAAEWEELEKLLEEQTDAPFIKKLKKVI